MTTAIFPGSFDPITNGHMDIIVRAAKLFDSLVVAVLINPLKPGYLPLEERVDMIRRATAGLPNVSVESFSGLLVTYAVARGAQVVVRGLRSTGDYEYEAQMAQLNRSMESSVETLCMMTSPQHAYVSSSRVREIAGLGGDISGLVPQGLQGEICAAFRNMNR